MNTAWGLLRAASTGGKKLKAKTLPALLSPSHSHSKGQRCVFVFAEQYIDPQMVSFLVRLMCLPSEQWHAKCQNYQSTSESWNVIIFIPHLMSVLSHGKFITFRQNLQLMTRRSLYSACNHHIQSSIKVNLLSVLFEALSLSLVYVYKKN